MPAGPDQADHRRHQRQQRRAASCGTSRGSAPTTTRCPTASPAGTAAESGALISSLTSGRPVSALAPLLAITACDAQRLRPASRGNTYVASIQPLAVMHDETADDVVEPVRREAVAGQALAVSVSVGKTRRERLERSGTKAGRDAPRVRAPPTQRLCERERLADQRGASPAAASTAAAPSAPAPTVPGSSRREPPPDARSPRAAARVAGPAAGSTSTSAGSPNSRDLLEVARAFGHRTQSFERRVHAQLGAEIPKHQRRRDRTRRGRTTGAGGRTREPRHLQRPRAPRLARRAAATPARAPA